MDAYPKKIQVLGASGKKVWSALERSRRQKAQTVGLHAKNGEPFWVVLTPEVLSLISEIAQDRGFLSSLKLPQSYVRARSKEALKKEAYYSSRIEGAVTSLEAALRHMAGKKRDFTDESVQMICNNKLALEFMHRHKDRDFSHARIGELQKILVHNTHRDRAITVGHYRTGPIYVVDGQGRVVYEGPPADKAARMMDELVRWMNREKAELHPLVDAALAHLHFVHVHPFDDGNGRSARALSNLYLEKQGYDFINLLSPSDYFEHHKAAYYRSIQATAEHGYDTTFFVLYYLAALKSELQKIRSELKKDHRLKDIRELLDESISAKLNTRQVRAIGFMLGDEEPISTQRYCKLNKCSDETARKDFNQLQDLKLFKPDGSGRSTRYFLKI